MAWLGIAVLRILLWVVSLCTVLYASSRACMATFLANNNNNNGVGRKNVLLVIAHPEDESMFFSPSIIYLTSRGHNLYISCISTGNAEGIGNIRKAEIYQACAVLQVPLKQVKVLDHPDLQDGFRNAWSHHLLSELIEEEMSMHSIDVLISFDNYGVSGHRNHCDVHHGTRMALGNYFPRDTEAWELISASIIYKYTGPVQIWFSVLCTFYYPRGDLHCMLNSHLHESFLAMGQHESQWIWFRKLFVLFSCYTYINTLKRITVASQEQKFGRQRQLCGPLCLKLIHRSLCRT